MVTEKMVEAAVKRYREAVNNFLDHDDAMRAALEAAEAAAWEPIETAPKDGSLIEVCEGDTTGQPMSFVIYRPEAGSSYVWFEPDHDTPRCPTHWRRPPSPPKDAPHG